MILLWCTKCTFKGQKDAIAKGERLNRRLHRHTIFLQFLITKIIGICPEGDYEFIIPETEMICKNPFFFRIYSFHFRQTDMHIFIFLKYFSDRKSTRLNSSHVAISYA